MLALRIKKRQDGQSVIALLTRAQAAFQDLTPAWEQSITKIQRAFRTTVNAGGGPFGTAPFPALSPAYAVRKAARYPGKPILVASGAMLRSLTNRRGQGALREITPKGFRFGTAVSVGKWNLYEIHAGKAPNSPVPKRDPAPVREGIDLIVRREILRHLRQEIRGGLKGLKF